MPKKTYDQREIESLLNQLPKVEDKRSRDTLFTEISNSIEEESPVSHVRTKQKKRSARVHSTFAAIAAVLLLAILVPSLMINDSPQFSMDDASRNADSDQAVEEKENDDVQIQRNEAERDMTDMEKREAPQPRMATVPEQLTSHTVNEVPPSKKLLTVALIDSELQYVVPVSMTIEKDAELDHTLNQFELTNKEADSRFSNEMLEGVTFTQKSEHVMQVDLPRDHFVLSKSGSSGEVLFLDTLKEMFAALSIEKIEFQTEGETGVNLAHYGALKTLEVKREPRMYYAVKGTAGNERSYLAPKAVSSEATFESTLREMEKQPIEQTLVSPFPANVTLDSIKEEREQEKVTVSFTNKERLQSNQQTLLLIEAILMAAKSFGFKQVEFENMPFETIGDYRLAEPISVPAAANKFYGS